MRALRQHPVVVGATTALLVLAAAGPVQAGPAPWLTATPTSSPISLAVGGAPVTLIITNTDRRTSSSALTVTLTRSPASAPFGISDQCAGVVLPPGGICTVEVKYLGTVPPTSDHTASLTVASGRPLKGSVTRVLEVDVTFDQVCAARGGQPGRGGFITVVGSPFEVGHRCDWDTSLATAEYNANFEALSPECRDLGQGTVGHPSGGTAGNSAIGCVN